MPPTRCRTDQSTPRRTTTESSGLRTLTRRHKPLRHLSPTPDEDPHSATRVVLEGCHRPGSSMFCDGHCGRADEPRIRPRTRPRAHRRDPNRCVASSASSCHSGPDSPSQPFRTRLGQLDLHLGTDLVVRMPSAAESAAAVRRSDSGSLCWQRTCHCQCQSRWHTAYRHRLPVRVVGLGWLEGQTSRSPRPPTRSGSPWTSPTSSSHYATSTPQAVRRPVSTTGSAAARWGTCDSLTRQALGGLASELDVHAATELWRRPRPRPGTAPSGDPTSTSPPATS